MTLVGPREGWPSLPEGLMFVSRLSCTGPQNAFAGTALRISGEDARASGANVKTIQG